MNSNIWAEYVEEYLIPSWDEFVGGMEEPRRSKARLIFLFDQQPGHVRWAGGGRKPARLVRPDIAACFVGREVTK